MLDIMLNNGKIIQLMMLFVQDMIKNIEMRKKIRKKIMFLNYLNQLFIIQMVLKKLLLN